VSEPAPGGVGAGLCDRCRHQQLVPNTRGSVFSLCRRSRSEPDRFRKYPPLPVLRCPGFQDAGTESGGTTEAGGGSGR
jgi:hypothetical protein